MTNKYLQGAPNLPSVTQHIHNQNMSTRTHPRNANGSASSASKTTAKRVFQAPAGTVASGQRTTLYLPGDVKADAFRRAEENHKSLSQLVTELLTGGTIDYSASRFMLIDNTWLPVDAVPEFYRSQSRVSRIDGPLHWKDQKLQGGLVLWWEATPRPGDTVLLRDDSLVTLEPSTRVPPKDVVGVVFQVLPTV